MSRSIRFRSWNLDEECMLDFGCLMQTAFNCLSVNEGSRLTGPFSPLLYNHVCQANTLLMPWTGLRDADGKEIYLGDVVSLSHPDRAHKYVFHHAVCWDHHCCGYVFRCFEMNSEVHPLKMTYDRPTKDLFVIGNVCEDPHLIPDGFKRVFYPSDL